MPQVHELAELAPRDVVAHAIVRQMAATGCDHVFLDARHLGGDFLRRRFPTIDERLRAEGIDFANDLVPVAPAQHYHSGGVVTDVRGRSDLEGLYAAGEAACTGVHGANRLASNSLLEGLVFAHRAADEVAARVSDGDLVQREPVTRGDDEVLVAAAARSRIQQLAAAGPGVIRSGEALTRVAGKLADLPDRVGKRAQVEAAPQVAEWETTNLLQLAQVLTETSLARTESRGGHFREDFPGTDEAWRLRQVVRLQPDGRLATEPLPVTG
jgi:L-aspartate oxidase